MPINKLKNEIKELKNEAEKLKKYDEFKTIHLDGIIQDVELKIIDSDNVHPETKSMIAEIEEIINKYEVEYPKVTKVLNRIMNLLSSIGI